MLLRVLIFAIVCVSTVFSQAVKVEVQKEVANGVIKYTYCVINQGEFPVTTLSLGDHEGLTGDPEPDFEYETTATAPEGWTCEYGASDESYVWYFHIPDQETPGNFEKRRVNPGSKLGGFVLTRT